MVGWGISMLKLRAQGRPKFKATKILVRPYQTPSPLSSLILIPSIYVAPMQDEVKGHEYNMIPAPIYVKS